MRVIELFRELDADQSGAVSKKEFRKGMKTLGLEVPKEDVNKLFDSWDPDGSGSLEFQELNKILKRGGGRVEKKRKTDAITQAELASAPPPEKSQAQLRRERTAATRGERTALLRGLVLDRKEGAPPIQDQLRAALSEHAVRIIDLFREWDSDLSGAVDKKEFRKAMPMLGLKGVSKAEIDSLFDSFDPDGSGSVEYKELNKLLRRGGEVRLSRRLSAGGAGEIVLKAKLKTAARGGKLQQAGSKVLRGVQLVLAADDMRPISVQLRDALAANAVRVCDLFREWDLDGNGCVTKVEFRNAMPLLGLKNVPKKEIDAVFDSLDTDGGGQLEMKELERQLRRGGEIVLEGKLATGAVPIVTDAKIASKGAAQATRERIEREGRQ